MAESKPFSIFAKNPYSEKMENGHCSCKERFCLRDGKVLLGLRHYTKDVWKDISVWTTPGGRALEGEELGTSLLRETKEETGITDLVFKRYLGTYPGSIIGNGDIVHVFLCETPEEAKLMEPDKFSEWRWFPITELPENLISPHLGQMIKNL